MDKQSKANIIKFVAFIQLSLSVFFILPIAVGFFYNENITSFVFFDFSLFLSSVLILYFLRKHKINLSVKEGILSVNLIWIILGLVGAIPLILATDVNLSSAFFEAVSGFTTTGASIYADISGLPKHILILRSLFNWLGGMGIIVLGVGLYALINPCGSLTLFKAESTGITTEKLTPKIKDTALKLWKVYALITVVDAILLFVAGMNGFDALNHAMTTISTGGFSTKTESLGFYNNYLITWITTFFMVISGINFLAHLRLFSKDFTGYKTSESRVYLKIFIFISLALTLVHFFNSSDGFLSSLTNSSFTIASLLTTTGFMVTDYEVWSPFAIALIFLPMFIGGNAGSTSGGVKVIRYIVLFKSLSIEIKRILFPNAIYKVSVNKTNLKPSTVSAVMAFIIIYVLTNLFLSLYLLARGFDGMTAFTAAISMVGNIGPGLGEVGPTDNFTIFSWYDHIILSIFMIIGRLEFYTVLLVFTKKFWAKF